MIEASVTTGPRIEYTVFAHVIEGRELKAKDSNGMSDPVVKLSLRIKDGKVIEKKHTTILKKTLSPTWDEIFVFRPQLTEEEFNSKAELVFNVYDSNAILRDEIIGTHTVQLSSIYDGNDGGSPQAGSPKTHALKRWLFLIPAGKVAADTSKAQGYLRVHLSVAKPDEPLPGVADDDEDEEVPEGGGAPTLDDLVLTPPVIQQFRYEVDVRCFRAEHLPSKWRGVRAVVTFDGKHMETAAIRSKHPQFLQSVTFPIVVPTLSDIMAIHVVKALQQFRVSPLLLNQLSPRWINLYTRRNDRAPLIDYQGRMLVGIEGNRTNKSTTEGNMLWSGPNRIQMCQEPMTEDYILLFDLYLGAAFRGTTRVVIRWGHHKTESGKQKADGTMTNYYKRLKPIEASWPVAVDQIPNIVVSVESGSTLVGYLSFKASEIIGVKRCAGWQQLAVDVDEASADPSKLAGFLLFNMNVYKAHEVPGTGRPPLSQPVTQPFILRAFIYQARNLPAADKSGTSDPYVVVRVGDKRERTETITETLFPVWYSTLDIPVKVPTGTDRLFSQQILIDVFDYDFGESDDFLGRAVVPLSSVSTKFPGLPSWVPLCGTNPDHPEGELLCSFQLLPAYRLRAPPDLAPPTRPCIVRIKLIDIHVKHSRRTTPYLICDCGKNDKVATVSTRSRGSALEVIELRVRLPIQSLFAPALNVRVMGSRTVLGSASIPLGPYLPWSDTPPTNSALPPRVVEILREEAPDLEEEALLEVGEEDVEDTHAAAMERMQGVIPCDIEAANEDALPEFAFKSSSTGKGIRTLPDVKETTLACAGDPGAEQTGYQQLPYEIEHELDDLPYDEFPLYRTKKMNCAFSFFKRVRKVRKYTGKIKAQVEVVPETPDALCCEALQQDLNTEFARREYSVCVYVIRARSLVPVPGRKEPSPYVKIRLGNQTIVDDEEHAQKKTIRPDFYSAHPFSVTLPGTSELSVEILDQVLGIDTSFGSTKIDLETRCYSKAWQAMSPKPTEWRTLWLPTSARPQGRVEVCVEIVPASEATPEQLAARRTFTPPKPNPYELRVEILNTRGVVGKDSGGKTSDIFVTAQLHGSEAQQTDVHWRSLNGEGMFNWRCIFPYVYPRPFPRLKLQLWDKDLVSPNDAIAECILNLNGLFRTAHRTGAQASLPKGWVEMYHPNEEGPQGEVELSIMALPQLEAQSYGAGKGRDPPNPMEPPDRPPTSYPPWRVDKKAKEFAGNLIANHKKKLLMTAAAVAAPVVAIVLISTFL